MSSLKDVAKAIHKQTTKATPVGIETWALADPDDAKIKATLLEPVLLKNMSGTWVTSNAHCEAVKACDKTMNANFLAANGATEKQVDVALKALQAAVGRHFFWKVLFS